MKKIMIFTMVVFGAAGTSYFVFAQEQSNVSETAGICQIHLMTAQSLIQRQIVTPADGGVIILVGNKLLKYDKDLNLLREAEFEVDLEKTYKEIYKMIETCPACRETQR
ncbi:MAG: hypothetical protein ABSE89_10665 [Sedimentisphaerales bacterium]